MKFSFQIFTYVWHSFLFSIQWTMEEHKLGVSLLKHVVTL